MSLDPLIVADLKKMIHFEYNEEEGKTITHVLSHVVIDTIPSVMKKLMLNCVSMKTFLTNIGRYTSILELRNLTTPSAVACAPIDYGDDWALIMNHNKKYDGHFLALRFTNLMIIDLDNGESLEVIKERLNDLLDMTKFRFAVHQSSSVSLLPSGSEEGGNGNNKYHLICLSHPIEYSSYNANRLFLGLKADHDYVNISIYRGYNVKVISKEESVPLEYKLVAMLGSGEPDPRVERLYQLLLTTIATYRQYNIYSFNKSREFRLRLLDTWIKRRGGKENMGRILLETSMRALLEEVTTVVTNDGGEATVVRDARYQTFTLDNVTKITEDDYHVKLSSLIKYRNIKKDLETYRNIWNWAIRKRNYYHVIQSTDDWVIGVDLVNSIYFIGFSKLLVLDYDDKSKLGILAHFCRNHPEYTFRVATSLSGYHCFCTSHYHHYDSAESYWLLDRLRTDPLHILCNMERGYYVRINRKMENEKPKKSFKIGKGKEKDDLVHLFDTYLELSKQMRKHPTIVKATTTNALEMLC